VSAERYIEAAENALEVPVLGGDVTEGVVRVGDTVRRPLNVQSPAIHEYLRHLEKLGFAEVPRFLGIDGRGREVLTYVPGEMAGRPLHAWAGGEDVLVSIACLQRRLHNHSRDVILPAGIAWRPPVHIEGLPQLFARPDVVAHNDMTPENIIFDEEHVPVGLIDFDLAGPTTRLLDIVTTLRWWAPLCDPLDRDPVLRELDAAGRMRIFVDAYGLERSERRHLVDLAERRCTRTWHVMHHRAVHDGGGWARMWEDGVGDVIRRTQAWLARERTRLEAALDV
jgi:hypothetical protein